MAPDGKNNGKHRFDQPAQQTGDYYCKDCKRLVHIGEHDECPANRSRHEQAT